MLIFKTLQARNQDPDLFEHGEYAGLPGTGLAAEHTVAVLRKRTDRFVLAVVPRLVLDFSALEKWPVGKRTWKDSAIVLPENAPTQWTNLITGETVRAEGTLAVADALNSFPLALLAAQR